jgi:serine phosphatase RsbU (regulator of sigma subunit)
MSRINLKNLLSRKKETGSIISALIDSYSGGLRVEDTDGNVLLGSGEISGRRVAISVDDTILGYVVASNPEGNDSQASAVASVVTHLCAREAEKKTLGNEILHLYREINLIYNFSESLATQLEVTAVAEMSLSQARHLISATSGAVMLLDDSSRRLTPVASFGNPMCGSDGLGLGEGLLGAIAEKGTGEIVNDVSQDARYVEDGIGIKSLICAPLKVTERLRGAIILANSETAQYTAGDLKLFTTLALQTATAIENALLYEQMIEAGHVRERLLALHKELEVAKVIQNSIVPRVFPPFPERSDFEILAEMIPAKEVGGDFFDFFLIDEERLGFAIGDVSGKGVPAALFMAVTRTLLKATALRGLSPEECMEHVNRVLKDDSASHMFVTCFYGILNTGSGEVAYCNAGHNPPYVLRADGRVEITEMTGGLALGMRARTTYRAKEIRLQDGDGIFLYTDGITEAMDVALNEYSEERLQACLSKMNGSKMPEILASVLTDVRSFAGEAEQTDDMTLLMLRRLKS